MRYITVAELREYAAQKAVTAVVVHGSQTGYALVVRLTWRDEEHLLVSHHGQTPREWTSFDRLRGFLQHEEILPTELVVKFNE